MLEIPWKLCFKTKAEEIQKSKTIFLWILSERVYDTNAGVSHIIDRYKSEILVSTT